MTYFIRTEDGVAANVTKEVGLAEANRCMMDGKREVAEMTAVSGFYYIWYKDGRKVTLSRQDGDMPKPAEAETIKLWTGQTGRIVTVKGKRYVAGTVNPAREAHDAMGAREAYVHYWSERNGKPFGATRFGQASSKPGTVARAVWDAVNR